jgi:hypothetical protein
MSDFLQRLKTRKLVQWAVAYGAFAFALIQVVDVASDSYEWPHFLMHLDSVCWRSPDCAALHPGYPRT